MKQIIYLSDIIVSTLLFLLKSTHWDDNNKTASYGGNTSLTTGIFNEEFHVFSLVWDAKKIVWYPGDKKFHEINTTPAELSEFQ